MTKSSNKTFDDAVLDVENPLYRQEIAGEWLEHDKLFNEISVCIFAEVDDETGDIWCMDLKMFCRDVKEGECFEK